MYHFTAVSSSSNTVNGKTTTRTKEEVYDPKNATVEIRETRNGNVVSRTRKSVKDPQKYMRSRVVNSEHAVLSAPRFLLSRRATNAALRGHSILQAVGILRRCRDDKHVGLIIVDPIRGGGVRVKIRARINMPDGPKGFHLHESGDARDAKNGCKNACAHYSRTDSEHGGVNTTERHTGDLGNVTVRRNKIDQTIRAFDLTVAECFGRAFILHEKEDDLGLGSNAESLVTGNSGSRYAYAVMGIGAHCKT